MAHAPSMPDIAVAGFVVTLALVAFIAVLWLNREGGKVIKEREAGTAFVTEGGKSVRRSTRARKAVPEASEPTSPKVRGRARSRARRQMRACALNNAPRQTAPRPMQTRAPNTRALTVSGRLARTPASIGMRTAIKCSKSGSACC